MKLLWLIPILFPAAAYALAEWGSRAAQKKRGEGGRFQEQNHNHEEMDT